MARDRNVSVWQAYVTVMSIVSLACLGAMAFVIFQSGTNSKTVEAANEKEQAAQDALRVENNRRQLLESMLGVGKPISEAEFNQLVSSVTADEQLNAAIKTYTNNMALFGPGATDRNYTKLVTTLMQELRDRNRQVDSLGKTQIALKDEFDSKLSQETKAREAEKQNAQDLSNLRDKELVKYTEDIKAQQEMISKIEADKNTLLKSLEKKHREVTAKFDKSQVSIGELEKRLDSLVHKLDEIQGEDFQYVQGKITEVANGGETVYINLGRADGLRPGVSFGVVNSDVSRVADAKPKAKIEVVEVISGSEHLSRCKVLSDRAPTTILRGDSIYSPAWQPGRKVEFALVGKMDIDGDGKDDRETVKALIEQNGGRVTVDLAPAGKVVGQLSVDTRWMVMGEDFKVRGLELDSTETAAAKERGILESQAKSMGISRINLDKLMGWLRGSGANEVSPLGNSMKSGVLDFRTGPRVNDNPGRVSPIFQNRDGTGNKNSLQPINK